MAEKQGPGSFFEIESGALPPAAYVFLPVTSFVAVPGSSVGDVDLSWSNPSHPEYVKTIVRRKVGSYPTGPTDGSLVYEGGSEAVTDSGLPTGITYLYAAFTVDTWGIYSNAALTSSEPLPPDLTAPPPITNFVATPGPGKITLTWDNPVDPDFAGVMIRRRDDGTYPTDETDGDLVYNGSGESTIDSGLNHLKTYYYSAFAFDAPIQGPPPNYGSAVQVSESPDIEFPTSPRLDEMGLIEAMTGCIGEQDTEIGGFRITRTTAVVTAGSANVPVESALDWPDTGKVSIDGVKYTYTSRTDDTLVGVSYRKAGSTISGAAIDHREQSAVVEISKEWSALEQLRRALLVEYAEGEDLNALGRNLGVNRLPIFENDDQFREVIKVMAYNPKGTIWGLALALTGLVGEGNFEIYEDMLQYPNTVFIRLLGSALVENVSQGKAFLTGTGYGISGVVVLNEVPLPANTLSVGSIRLAELNELFDLRTEKPSAITYPYYPGHGGGSAWTYMGTESETTGVVTSGGKTRFEILTPGNTAYYQMTPQQGARITPESYVEVNFLGLVPNTSALEQYDYDQIRVVIYDGLKEIKAGIGWGVFTFYNTAPGPGTEVGDPGLLGSTNIWYDITIKKFGTSHVEMWVDGNLVTRVDYADFSQITSTRAVEIGIAPNTPPNYSPIQVDFKQWSVVVKAPNEYWSAQANGSTSTSNPTRLTIPSPGLFLSGDVGKSLITRDSRITKAGGGNNNGNWLIETFIDAQNVELVGPTRSGASVSAAYPDRIVLGERDLVYPDDLGNKIVIENGTYAGTYVIQELRDPDDPSIDLDGYATPIRTKTNVCEVASLGAASTETDLDVHLEPVFVTELAIDYELSNAGEITGTSPTQVAELRQDLWAGNLVMAISYSDVLSAQILLESIVLNTVIQESPLLFEYYPFYLADPLGIVQLYLDTITAAGVIPEFLIE